MDSRTKFYGSVLAMLALSSVAINGFPATHRPASEAEDSSPPDNALPSESETLATSTPTPSSAQIDADLPELTAPPADLSQQPESDSHVEPHFP